MGFKIRTFAYEDLGQVKAIEKASFPDPYSDMWFRLLKLRAGEGFIVAEEKGVVGYAISEVRRGRGHIVSMTVSPECRRGGIGAALLQELIRRLEPRVHEVHLEVRTGNDAAIQLYEKFSFKRTGEIKERYYPDGEDAIVTTRTL